MRAAAPRRPTVPTGAADDELDFLQRLQLAENRDGQIPHGMRPPQKPPAAPMAHAFGSDTRFGRPGGVSKPQLTSSVKGAAYRGRPRGQRICFHPNVVTCVEDCLSNVDRKVIPCLAFGGVSPLTPEEEKFVAAKVTIKAFRNEVGKQDAWARQHFNAAAAEEAQLRAAQIAEVNAVGVNEPSDSVRGRRGIQRQPLTQPTASDLAERHYQEHLACMQRANQVYQQHAVQNPQQQPEVLIRPPSQADFDLQKFHDQRMAEAQQQMVRQPPGGRSSFTFG